MAGSTWQQRWRAARRSSRCHDATHLQACKFIEENLAIKVDTLGKEALINCAKTAMSSKIIGGADEDFFAKMAVDAMLAVKTTTPEGKAR
jgi:T-complex protein 1 subunit alpha